jgi:lipopolysaccharide transport system permease protein
LIFGKILNIPYAQFLPYLSIGMISWGFVSTTITEGCQSFIIGEPVIKQMPLPFFIYILRIIWRNLTILSHTIVILPFTLALLPTPFSYISFLAIPGLLLVIVNLAWILLILAIVCARFRDLPQIITNLFQVIFYITPIMWMPSQIPDNSYLSLIFYNPFYHLIEVIRAPLLGNYPSTFSWWFCIISAIMGSFLGMIALGFYKKRIIYWL